MRKLSETPLPSMIGMVIAFSVVVQAIGRLVTHSPEVLINSGTVGAGLAGLAYGLIIWAEAGKHRSNSAKK